MNFNIKSSDLTGVMTLSITGGTSPLRASDTTHRPFALLNEWFKQQKFTVGKKTPKMSHMPDIEFVKTIVKKTTPEMFGNPSVTSFKEATNREPIRTKTGIRFDFKSIQECIKAHGLDWAYSFEPSLKGCTIEIKMMPAVGDPIIILLQK